MMSVAGARSLVARCGPMVWEGDITGVPAPALHRKAPMAWTKPEPLFDGEDLTGWEPGARSRNHWNARNGELVNERAGANIRTTRKFDDFKLHIECDCPKDGDSGVYLRGRYAIQVEYEPPETETSFGSIYGFLAPPPKWRRGRDSGRATT
ncbi:MAG TPA: DUF1080 domain-containing protein [Candidatus Solibacter sp.]|nr:DUF1080 domain-containing protein [Candidatus Solibacter sp.]